MPGRFSLPNLRSVTDGNSSTILEGTAGIEKDIFPYRDILSEIRVERGEHKKRFVNVFPRQSREQRSNLIGFVVRPIQFRRNAQCFVTVLD